MNRILLIGNGFDLAHGMETKYSHFIDNFWLKKLDVFIDSIKNNSLTRAPDYDRQNYNVFCYDDKEITVYVIDYKRIYQSAEIVEEETGFQTFNTYISHFRPKAHQSNYKFKNQFLGQITEKQQLQRWVDIEEEYYTALVECLRNKHKINKLHDDFSLIQNELQEYLTVNINHDITFNDKINRNIYSPLLQSDFVEEIKYIKLENILFLNFNYTPTFNLYSESRTDVKAINIHGQLNNSNNPVIFGYGDEIDDNYKLIEKESNDFLQNIKSFKYSKTNNYKELLAFINSDDYQIFVMGLSCGTSDRTLLNTLFEHKFCKSIKIFFYQKTDINDDYLDIYMNISRSFNDKARMREIVVSRENSVALS
jgi:hypothetical protein